MMTNEEAREAAKAWHGEAGGRMAPQLTENEISGLVNEALTALQAENDTFRATIAALDGQEPVAWSVTVGSEFKNCVEITHCESDAVAQYEACTEGGFESIYTLHKLYAAAGAAPKATP